MGFKNCHHIITSTVPLMLSVIREAVNINFCVFGFAGLGIKPKSTTAEATALLTRRSELPLTIVIKQKRQVELLNNPYSK